MIDQNIASLARNLINPAIEERRRPHHNDIQRVLAEMSARGIAHSSMTAKSVYQLCEQELKARNDLAWEALQNVHKSVGAPLNETLATDLKREVGIYRRDAKLELNSVMQQVFASVGYYQDSLDNAEYQAEQAVNGKIDVYVASLSANRRTGSAANTTPLVFISCGQCTDEEIRLGETLAKLVDDNLSPCKGYFARNQTTLDGLSREVFEALNRCVGFIAVMHHRGKVSVPTGDDFFRASVWVEQELAIAAFLQQTQQRHIKVAAYIQKGIKLEGVREKLAVNAKEFIHEDEVVEDFRSRIENGKFTPQGANDPEIRRQNGVLEKLRVQYVASHDNISPAMLTGLERLPKDWVDAQLASLGETWRREQY